MSSNNKRVLNVFKEKDLGNIKYYFSFENFWTRTLLYFMVTNEDHGYSKGENNRGELGLGHNRMVNEFEPIPELFRKNIIEIKQGNYCTIAKSGDNSIYAWGGNECGQLGRGFTSSINEFFKPAKVDFDNNPIITKISLGDYHNLALSEQGTLYAWGDNSWSQLGLSLKEGNITKPKRIQVFVEKNIKITEILCFSNTSFAITDDQDVYVWGENHWQNYIQNEQDKIEEPYLIPSIKAEKLLANEDEIVFFNNGKLIYNGHLFINNVDDILLDSENEIKYITKGKEFALDDQEEIIEESKHFEFLKESTNVYLGDKSNKNAYKALLI